MSAPAMTSKTSEGRQLSRLGERLRPAFPFGRALSLNPFGMMREFASEMDRMFRGDNSAELGAAWTPAVDVQQCGGNIVVSAELPGIRKEDLKVEVADDILTIQGERKQEHKEDDGVYHRWERSYGRFYRAIQLPQNAKTDQLKAELKDGILKVTIPAPETEKKARQIPVAG